MMLSGRLELPEISAPLEVQLIKDQNLPDEWYEYFADLTDDSIELNGVIQNVTRTTSATYTVLSSNYIVFLNTDSSNIIANIPAGIQGTAYKFVNTGSSGNSAIPTPNGSENLLGANSGFTLNDGESLIINFDAIDGWY